MMKFSKKKFLFHPKRSILEEEKEGISFIISENYFSSEKFINICQIPLDYPL